jgi:2-methylcitrate dehydratase PrpD
VSARPPVDLGPSARLARFASSLQPEDVPKAAFARMKLCVLDAVGCAMYGATLPWGEILSNFVVEQGGRQQSFVWGRSDRIPAAMAALVNGTLVHSFELDDLHKSSILHPSSVDVPAALAIAESRGGIGGAEFLTACVAGIEIGARVGMSVGTAHLLRGFHPTGTHGTAAAAAAAGRALGLDAGRMEHAISIGATQAAGLMASQFESMVKRMHAGRAAQSGVYGAELAARGFTGIGGVFEVDYGGYCSTLGDQPKLAALTDGLGATFEAEKVGFKGYSCCGSCHTSVEAARRILSNQRIDVASVERITVRVTRATLLHVGWPYEPRSVTAAQMNLPYCLAVTLLDGDAFVDQFSPRRIASDDVVALAKRVEVEHEPAFDALGPAGRHKVEVSLRLRDGTTIDETVDHAKGSDQDPLTEGEVVLKFHRLVDPICGEAWANRTRDAIMSLDVTTSTASLSDLLAHANPKSTN